MKAHRNRWSAACALLAVAALLAALGPILGLRLGWGFEDRGEVLYLRPDSARKGQPVKLPQGDVFLFEFLQRLADFSGQGVCWRGDAPPDTRIPLPRSLDALDLKAAEEVLEAAGYGISEDAYRGKTVYWVQRLLVPPRTKGKIVRSSRPTEGEEAPAGEGPGSSGAVAGGSSLLGLYQRQEGGGARFVVLFETPSREEAQEAVSLLKAHQRAKLQQRK